MKKSVPMLVMLGMITMATISWDNVLSYHGKVNQEFNAHIEQAEIYMEKKIYLQAIWQYQDALLLQPSNYKLAMKIVDAYKLMGDMGGYINALDSAIAADNKQEEPYLLAVDYYTKMNNNQSVYHYLNAANQVIDSKEVKKRLLELRKQHTVVNPFFEEQKGYISEEGKNVPYAVIKKDGKYGLADISYSPKIGCKYEDIGPYFSGLIPVKLDGEWYYISEDEYRFQVPDHPASWLGSFSDGYAAACIDNKYGYLDKGVHEYHFEYDYAGGFYYGIAAVKKGGKWALINSSFAMVTDFVFDDVLLDDYGFCSVYGRIFAKQNGKWQLYDTTGTLLADGLEDVRRFASTEPAAVKKDGKWCLMSQTGEIVLETKFKELNSMSCGYAPFREDKKWGCIDIDGNILIEAQFEKLAPFESNGYAQCMMDDIPKFLKVEIYEE